MTDQGHHKITVQVGPTTPGVGTGGPGGTDAAHAYRCQRCSLEFVRPSKRLSRVKAAILGPIGLAVLCIIPYLECAAPLPPTRVEVGWTVLFSSMIFFFAFTTLIYRTWLFCLRCKSRAVMLLDRPVTLLQELQAREPDKRSVVVMGAFDPFGYFTGRWTNLVVGLIVFLIMGSLVAAAVYHHFYG